MLKKPLLLEGEIVGLSLYAGAYKNFFCTTQANRLDGKAPLSKAKSVESDELMQKVCPQNMYSKRFLVRMMLLMSGVAVTREVEQVAI